MPARSGSISGPTRQNNPERELKLQQSSHIPVENPENQGEAFQTAEPLALPHRTDRHETRSQACHNRKLETSGQLLQNKSLPFKVSKQYSGVLILLLSVHQNLEYIIKTFYFPIDSWITEFNVMTSYLSNSHVFIGKVARLMCYSLIHIFIFKWKIYRCFH